MELWLLYRDWLCVPSGVVQLAFYLMAARPRLAGPPLSPTARPLLQGHLVPPLPLLLPPARVEVKAGGRGGWGLNFRVLTQSRSKYFSRY